MSTIKISDLHPTGSELFSDSESYMNELGDSELEATYGGSSPACLVSAVYSIGFTIISVSKISNPFNSI